MAKEQKTYILTDAAIRFVWIGGGIAQIETADLLRVPRWDDYQLARRAANALRLGGFKLKPTTITLSKRR